MRKFIINNNQIKLANVECHFEIANDHTTTKGGGWWHLDIKNKIVYLYAKSIDYGQAKREDLQELIKNECYPLSFDEHKFIHSYSDSLEDCVKDGVALN
jgi:hypothetical protein